MRHPLTLLAIIATLGVGTTVSAQEASTCAPTDRVAPTRFLRQLALDLLGRIPTEAEYRALLDSPTRDVEPETIEAMIGSDEHLAVLRGYHRQLLWGSLGDVNNLVSTRHRISRARIGANDIWFATQAGTLYRGDNGVSCVDVEHDRFDAAGHALPLVEGYRSGTVRGAEAPRNAARCTDGAGCRIDGWVMVRPYWAPDTQVRVCAFDAQAVARGTRMVDGVAQACDATVTDDAGCGCGPGLRYCMSQGAGGTEEAMRDALVEEPLRIFEDVIRRGQPYFDALSAPATMLDGRAAHYYRYTSVGVTFDAGMSAVPDLAWSDREWRRVPRDAEHAGALTTLHCLMRCASARGRANRFYTAFLCEPFESPAEGLPSATDPCSADPNLSTRCGCATCHERLEPTAAYFGRWRIGAQYGFLDARALPVRNMACATCTGRGCSAFCNTYYLTDVNTSHADERALRGTLQTAAWRTPAEVAAIDRGPAGLLEREGAMGRLASCSARTLAEQMLHRDLTSEEHLEWVPALASRFESTSYDFLDLVRAITTDERYRAIR